MAVTPRTEGVIVSLPVKGGGESIRALRYSSLEKIPGLANRAKAHQVGAAGFWYLPLGDTPGIWWDKLTDDAWVLADKAADAAGAAIIELEKILLLAIVVIVLGLVFVRGRTS